MKYLYGKNDVNMTSATALVTVCIPVFNGGKYLLDCLRSVSRQTLQDIVVIVIDNCSTDDTPDICKNYDDNRFYYIKNPKNVGAIRNHNLCLEYARTEFVKLLSADDVLLPETLELQLEAALTNPDVGIVTCNFIETKPDLTPLNIVSFLSGHRNGGAVINVCVSKLQNLIGGPSNTLLRTSVIGDHRYDLKYRWLADLEFHCRLLKGSNFINIDQAGFYYRRHNESDSVLGCPSEVRMQDELAFLKDYAHSVFPYVRAYIRTIKVKLSQFSFKLRKNNRG